MENIESKMWWKRYFVEYADEYLRRYKNKLDKRAEKEAFYLHGLLQYLEKKNNEKYKKILDVPCGYGRISKYLAEFGYNVTGVDISEKFIDIARIECRNCHFEVADMRNLPFENESFDVVLNIFTSFGYFSDEENEKVLSEFSRVLRVGGLLIMELINGNWIRLNFREMDIEEDEKYVTIIKRRLDWPRLYEKIVTFSKKGKEIEEGLEVYLIYSHYLRLYTSDELTELAKKYNLILLEALESWTLKKLDPLKSHRMMLIFMKI